MRVKTGFAIGVLLVGCGGDGEAVRDASVDAFVDPYTEILRIPITPNRDLDLLFVIDDSPSMLALQTVLNASFPTLFNVLNAGEGGLPNMHIGVASTDLGTKGAEDATAGSMVGTGPGSCLGLGKGGNLQTNGSTLLNGNFINDQKNIDGTRTTNYVGTLSSVMTAIASLGEAGCGFEQPLEAAKRALANNPANPGFLRPNASLAVLFVTNEDDCSFTHSTLLSTDTATLGPLGSFRCTRFGVTCTGGGATPGTMAEVGAKSGCSASEASPYTTDVGSYAVFLNGLKPDPHMVYVGAITGPTEPFEVASGPQLVSSCTIATPSISADPAVRVRELVDQFTNKSFETACASNLDESVSRVGQALLKLTGSSCLPFGLPADCIVYEERGSGTTIVPSCTTTQTPPCWRVVTDAQNCVANTHLKLDVMRSEAPLPDTVVSLRCKP